MSEPERVAASTTIVSVESAAMMRLRAGKHQRWPPKPGGISETTAPCLDEPGVQVAHAGGVRGLGAAGEDRDGRAAGPRLQRAEMGGRVDAQRHARRRPARRPPVRRGRASVDTSSPYGVARREPTIATASPCGSAAGEPAMWSTAGGSGSSRSRSG